MIDPRKILVLGGYGGFGGRIVRRLAEAGYVVIVAGRNQISTELFCAGQPNMQPACVDRVTDLTAVLTLLRPSILVDASGPFQRADLAVPRACIEAGVHYVDIADGRAFVTGISALDPVARAAGVVVISGASSVPALSGAVVRHLAEKLDHVDVVEMAISASNKATAGPSVAAAILSYVGRPISLWRGGRWTRAWGWQELEQQTFQVAGQSPVSNHLVALADVPDLSVLPTRLSGSSTITFKAGTELRAQMIGTWLLSWLVRWRMISNLEWAARWLLPLQKITARLGSDRSAMIVCVFGRDGHRTVERRWTLIANNGDGPEIPSLAVPIVVQQILANKLMPGAYDAGPLLGLADFEPAFGKLAIKHEVVELSQPDPLCARIMGTEFAALPEAMRKLHSPNREAGAFGRATVTGAGSRVGQLIARAVGFPPSGEHDLHVHFKVRDGVEIWTRTFTDRSFRSVLSQRGRRLVERFGPLAFAFDLPTDERGLSMVMRAWWIGPLRLPLMLAPRSLAREWAEGARFCFDVPIALPLIGLIVRYRGWLDMTDAALVETMGSRMRRTDRETYA